MNDLERRLRDHFEARVEDAVPVDTLDAILSGDTVVQADDPAASRRSPWMLGVAAALVLVLVGGLLVVRRGDTPAATPPPLPDDVPPTGAEWTQTGHLALETAVAVLRRECMARAGFEYDDDAEQLGLAMGAWQPHPVLGIYTEAAAQHFGYRMASPSFGPDVAAFALDEAERERFYEALMGPSSQPAIPVTLPDGSPAGFEMIRGGCMGEVDAAFDGALVQQEGLRVAVFESGLDQAAVTAAAQADPRVASALADWSACLTEAVGESAETPDELARRFAMSGVEVTDREIEVATADARCQADTGLQATWYEVVAEHQRASLDRPEWFDRLAAMRVEIVATARQILDERGIEVTEVRAGS